MKTDQLKTIDDLFEIAGVKKEDVIIPSASEHENAYRTLALLTSTVNGDWTADYNNTNQKKWVPWFYVSGSGLALHGVDYDYSHSHVGARLCYKTEELARWAAKQYIDVYTKFLL